MKRPLLTAMLAIAAFAAFGVAGAQIYERPTEVVFKYEQLTYRPGLVQISPNYTTVIEFPWVVQRGISSDKTLIEAVANQNRIFLRALKPAGQTDLIVVAGNQTMLFHLVVETNTFLPRKYRVEFPKPVAGSYYNGIPTYTGGGVPRPAVAPAPSARPAPAPAPAPAPTTSQPVGRPAPATTDAEPAPAAPAAEPAPATPAVEPPAPAPQPAPAYAGVPAGIEFHATATRSSEGAVAINYRITNKGERPLILDSARLEVLAPDGKSLDYQFIRITTGEIMGRLAPGETEEALVVVPNASEYTALTIHWPVTWLGDGTTTIQKTLTIE